MQTLFAVDGSSCACSRDAASVMREGLCGVEQAGGVE